MSLLDETFEAFTVVNRTIVDDGYGGVTPTWTDGITIYGAMVYDNSTQMKVAQAMGVTAAYTLTVRKSVQLDYHDIVRRQKDRKLFRITSDSDDNKTPESAALDMRQYSAEEWELSDE